MAQRELKKVLYVDDDPEIRSLVAMALGLGGLEVKLCASGAEALAVAPAFAPDIILLDVMMPGMDGPTTLTRLREIPKLRDTPMVFMTAARDAGALRGLGAVEVLFKPFDSMQLADQVRTVWTRHTNSVAAANATPQATAQSRDELQRSYVDGLPRKLHNLNELWGHLVHVDWSEGNLQKVITIAHNLKGSAASFGLPAIGSLAGTIEGQLIRLRENHDAPEDTERLRIDNLLNQLGELVGEVNTQIAAPHVDTAAGDGALIGLAAPAQHRQVYLAEDDGELAAWLALQLRQHGYLVSVFRTPEALLHACERQRPDVILSDVVFPGGENHGLAVVGTLLKKDPIPTLFLSGRVDLKARLIALRAGAAGYLMKPVDIGQLLSKLQDLLGGDEAEPYRVLIVEDDEATATLNAMVLGKAGMQCEVLTNPLKLMQPLLAFRPELILTDLHMPKINGFELAQLVRQEEAFANTPIIFLSADADERHLVSSAVAGGDTFLTKPIDPAELTAIVRSRLKRVRTLNRRMEYLAHRDPVSGVLNRAWFQEELERALLTTSSAPAALLSVSFDNYHVFADQLPPMQMNQFMADWTARLREQLTEADLFGRYGDSGFVVFARRPSREALAELAQRLLVVAHRQQALAGELKLSSAVSIGVQGADGRPAHALVAAARFLARRAHSTGGGQVVVDEVSVDQQRHYADEQLYLTALREGANAVGREFRLHFQPLVSLKEESAACYEAMLGLYDAQGTQYPMDEVLDVALRNGLEARLDRKLLDRTLSNLTEGPLQRGREKVLLKVSVSGLSGEELTGLLRERAPAPAVNRRLVFMVSYQGAWTNLELLKQQAKQLATLGCGLGIEQFTGDDEAMQLLGLLPLSYVKFDRLLTDHLERDGTRAKALAQVVQECHKRGIKVLAGNEERSSMMLYLAEIDVDYIQVNVLLDPSDYVSLEVITVDEQSTQANPIWNR